MDDAVDAFDLVDDAGRHRAEEIHIERIKIQGYFSWAGFNSGYFPTIGYMISKHKAPIDLPIIRRYSLNSSLVHKD